MKRTPGLRVPNDDLEVWIPDSHPDDADRLPPPHPSHPPRLEQFRDLPLIEDRG